MATAKKSAKKPATKKAPARSTSKTTVKRVAKPAAAAKSEEMRSFAPARSTEPFFTFRISHQTLYWLLLAIVVLALGVWVVNINDKVQRIYDQIDQTNSAINDMPEPTAKKTAQ